MANFFKKHPKLHIFALIAALVAAVGMLASVGTFAWLRYTRSLHTVTLVQIPTLSLKGASTDTLVMDIGDIDVESSGKKENVFRVTAGIDTNYIIQLAHTTNIPLTYTIYPVEEGGSNQVVEGNVTYSYGTPLAGGYLNQDSSGLANSSLHSETYGSYQNVQKNAEPLYWQSDVQTSDGEDTYYVLVISWGSGLKNDKETDMIYLTVGMGGANETQ